MQTYETLKRVMWEGKYPAGFITKCRKKTLAGQIRGELGSVFRALARQQECEIIAGHRLPDHVPRRIWLPLRYAVGSVRGS